MMKTKAALAVIGCFSFIIQAHAAGFDTVPTVSSWAPSSGEYQVGANPRIVISSSSIGSSSTINNITTTVSETAAHFSDDLENLGLNFSVVNGGSTNNGDIRLSLLGSYNSSLGDEGYIIDVGNAINIRANTTAGLYYGTQSILQVLKQDSGHNNVPKGRVEDSPSLPERGIMIDAGRKYWTKEYLKDLIRNLGWNKMNRLHLHLTEWNAFRLASDNADFDGLAALGAYTKSDIDELEAFAKKHHVVIVPEIDIPGHAKLLGDYSKEDAFSCYTLSEPQVQWEGSSGPRWTINYTGVSQNSPNTGRDFLENLLSEFVPWFDGPYFHIGTDEVPEGYKLSNCAELTNYVADTPSLTKNGDVLVEAIDELNDHVKSLGKKTQMWNWYERQSTTIEPSNDILVDVWAGNAESAYINLGFDVIKTGDGGFYLTPGFVDTFPSNDTIYTWNNTTSSHLKGVKVSVWTDTAYTWPDYQFENLMFEYRAVSAERNWAGAQSSSKLSGFLSKVHQVGASSSYKGEQNAITKDNWQVHNVSSQETAQEDGSASNIFDGVGTTIWHSKYSGGVDSFPHSVALDLGAEYDLYGARFQARRNQNQRNINGLVDNYNFQVSTDGVTWTNVVSNGEFYDLVNNREARSVYFSKKTARYVRFTGLSATNGQDFASLAELDLFGTSVGGQAVTQNIADIQMRPKADMSVCLGVNRESGSVSNGDLAELRKCDRDDPYQRWEKWDQGGGNVSFRMAMDTTMCLDIDRGPERVINDGDQMLVWKCHLGPNQQWQVSEVDYGFFNLKSKGNTNACIDIDAVADPVLTPNDRIEVQSCTSHDQQQWVLVE